MIPSLRPALTRLRRSTPRMLLAMSAVALGAGGALCVNGVRATTTPPIDPASVRAALKLRLPRTPIGAIDCRAVTGLCEVVAGKSLFYVDRAARFLLIGHVYDMDARRDVTAARLLALDPAKLLPAQSPQALADGGADPSGSSASGASQPTNVRPQKVNLAELPAAGAIIWGKPAAPRLVVLSDFACSYCRKLTTELAQLNVRVEERPISIFGPTSRRVAEQVLCAPDPVAALHTSYRGERLPAARRCDTRGLDANEAFARGHGFGGTPVMIRGDGAVLEGYRPAEVIKAFIEGQPS